MWLEEYGLRWTTLTSFYGCIQSDSRINEILCVCVPRYTYEILFFYSKTKTKRKARNFACILYPIPYAALAHTFRLVIIVLSLWCYLSLACVIHRNTRFSKYQHIAHSSYYSPKLVWSSVNDICTSYTYTYIHIHIRIHSTSLWYLCFNQRLKIGCTWQNASFPLPVICVLYHTSLSHSHLNTPVPSLF